MRVVTAVARFVIQIVVRLIYLSVFVVGWWWGGDRGGAEFLKAGDEGTHVPQSFPLSAQNVCC